MIERFLSWKGAQQTVGRTGRHLNIVEHRRSARGGEIELK